MRGVQRDDGILLEDQFVVMLRLLFEVFRVVMEVTVLGEEFSMSIEKLEGKKWVKKSLTNYNIILGCTVE